MSPEEHDDLAVAAAALRQGTGIRAVEVMLQIRGLARAGILVDLSAVENHLRRPLADASPDELRGVIAALNAIGRAR